MKLSKGRAFTVTGLGFLYLIACLIAFVPEASPQIRDKQKRVNIAGALMAPSGQAQPCPETRCPRTIGYWKNHDAHLAQMIAMGQINLGGGVVITTVAQALAVLEAADATDARVMLRAQLLATILNLRNGANPIVAGFDVRLVVSAAIEFLNTHPNPVEGGHPDREEGLRLKDSLDVFNNAQCDEEAEGGGGGTVNCASVTIIKEVLTSPGSSTIAFDFRASANFAARRFSLVDDNEGSGVDRITNDRITAFGEANAIFVTEEFEAGWTLGDIVCTDGSNTLPNLEDRTVRIVVQPGESVTCIFRNIQLGATAAPVGLSGRVVTSKGLGIAGARLTVTNAMTGETRSAASNAFGIYSFDALEAGEFYFLTISHRRYRFAEPTKSVMLQDNLSGFDFVANGR